MIGAEGNANIFIFEVGIRNVVEVFGVQLVTTHTVSIHPLLVAPTSIRYTNTSRDAVTETLRGSVRTPGGRALETVALEGTFGHAPRGLLFYLGNGETLFQRFYKEVVRMGAAVSAEQVRANTDYLLGTPLIWLLLAPYNPKTSTFFINWYDLWNGRSFEASITSFQHSRSHQKGGAVGLVSYQMQIRECGPPVTGSLGSAILGALLTAFSIWNAVEGVLNSYTLSNILGAQFAVLAIGASELAGMIDAVTAQIESVRSLMSGEPTSTASTGIASFVSAAASLSTAAASLAAAAASLTAPPATSGVWSAATAAGDGSATDAALAEGVAALYEVSAAAAAAASAGAYYGMSPAEFAAYLASGGGIVADSATYVVQLGDSVASIEARFAVTFDDVLNLNRMTPAEALYPGTSLLIPMTLKPGAIGVDGIPTLGSHRGKAAWGADVTMDLRVGADGDLELLREDAVLQQGGEMLVEILSEGVITHLSTLPTAARGAYLEAKLGQGIPASDKRVQSVSAVEVDDGAQGLSVRVRLRAITGEEV
jgi:hypothetical protein